MAYPGVIDSFSSPQGTTLVAVDDHAKQHRDVGTAVINIETTLGTNGGTSVLKNFSLGNFAARTAGETMTNLLVQSGTVNASGGTLNSLVIGTSSFTGGTITSALITNGTANNLTLGTPVIGTIAVPGTTNPLSVGAGLAPTVSTLTDAVGTIATNAQLGQVFYLVIGTTAGNRTIDNPSNSTEGQAINYRVKQNSGNTGTILWGANFRFSSDIGTPSLGTASTLNYFSWRYNLADTKWDFQGLSKNII